MLLFAQWQCTLSGCHQDLVYLTTEKVLGNESAQALHSYYSFMLVSLVC